MGGCQGEAAAGDWGVRIAEASEGKSDSGSLDGVEQVYVGDVDFIGVETVVKEGPQKELVEAGEFAILDLGFTDGSVDSSYHVFDVPQPVLRGKGQQQFVSGHWRQKTSEFKDAHVRLNWKRHSRQARNHQGVYHYWARSHNTPIG